MIASSCCSSAVLLFSFGALLRSLIVKPLLWTFDQCSEWWIDPTAKCFAVMQILKENTNVRPMVVVGVEEVEA